MEGEIRLSKLEEKLNQMGLIVPEAPKPVAAYVPGVVEGGKVYTSGQLPIQSGALVKGKLGETLSVEEGYAAARTCALNCLGVLKSLIGDLNKVEQILKVVGYVNSTPEFDAQAKVVNGASELLGEVFGKAGIHARSAVGVAALPLGAACEIEIIAKIREN